MKRTFLFLSLIIIAYPLFSQISGNSTKGNSNYSNYNQSPIKSNNQLLFLNDSTFLISANILYHVKADSLVAVFAVHEQSTTVKECNEKINQRINQFIASLASIGINTKNIYVDMTTQTKLIDYHVDGNKKYAEQYISGFEVNKNVIIPFAKSELIDKIILKAADASIYDIVKVDYISTQNERIYEQMLDWASNIIAQKKAKYSKLSDIKFKSSRIYSEDYVSYYPTEMYSKYTADEVVSSLNYSYKENYIIKNLNSGSTYYYDKLDYSGFDKIANSVVSEPGIQYVLNLKMVFKIDKK